MAKFFGKLNSPVALIVVVVLFVALNGFLFYGYQLDSLPSIVGTQPATETDPASDESSADTSSEEEAASSADPSPEEEAASEAEEAPAPEESAATEEEANSGEAAGAEEGAAPSEESNPGEAAGAEEGTAPSDEAAAEAESALRTVVSVVDAPTSLSIQVDGESVLEGVSEPGFSRQFEADRETIISTDNAGAVLVELNGYGLGALGASGEPATRTFTAGT
jgi:cytoskeletal protein RodZ